MCIRDRLERAHVAHDMTHCVVPCKPLTADGNVRGESVGSDGLLLPGNPLAAEALARAGGFDEVRVDIFVGPRGAPHLCQVNEISLTSGSKYGMHAMFLANLWGEVHASRARGVCSSDQQKVYERNACIAPVSEVSRSR